MTELSKLLAPLGVNEFGVSVVLLILNEAIKKNNKKDKTKRRFINFHPLVELVAPLEFLLFFQQVSYLSLDKIFRMKERQNWQVKLKKGGSMSSLVKHLNEKLSRV